MAVDREKSFWLSYSDLMTSLFFIMLVLFIVSVPIIFRLQKEIGQLENELGELKVTNEQYRNILQLEEQFKRLSSASTLRYDEKHRTFVAKDFEGIEIFEPEKDIIKNDFLKTVDKVGKDLENLLKELNSQNPDFKYLLVIEGNSANKYNHSMSKDKEYNYNLSYKRALALYYRWQKQGIDLRKYNTEIQICGSGLNGINRDTKVEENNKRFVIQIIPKVSKPN